MSGRSVPLFTKLALYPRRILLLTCFGHRLQFLLESMWSWPTIWPHLNNNSITLYTLLFLILAVWFLSINNYCTYYQYYFPDIVLILSSFVNHTYKAYATEFSIRHHHVSQEATHTPFKKTFVSLILLIQHYTYAVCILFSAYFVLEMETDSQNDFLSSICTIYKIKHIMNEIIKEYFSRVFAY